MDIKIDSNSDTAGEIEELKTLLKSNKHYLYMDYTNKTIVQIAVQELRDRLIKERNAGENQRKI